MNTVEVIQKFKVKNTKRLRIAVIGDTLIDEYRYGNVNRISPEFPVPVLTSESNVAERCPGGAANVCHQMTHMNADVFLLGFVDSVTRKLYSDYSFKTDYCVDLTTGSVPIKIRFYEEDFPLLRWDIERPNYGEPELDVLRKQVLENFKVLAKEGLDALIVSDYHKGLFNDNVTAIELMNLCNKYKIKAVVDPKKGPLWKWQGAQVIKPNAAEAAALTESWTVEGQLSKLCEVAAIALITQSGQGVRGQLNKLTAEGVVRENFEYQSPVMLRSKEVNSVIGAGDCFIAMFTLALSHGMTAQEATALAFEAGAVYVKSKHNHPVRINDILARVDIAASRIVTAEELIFKPGEKIVFTNGCFDVMHIGHMNTIKWAKCQGDRLVIGINSDESVRRLKGPTRPIYNQRERAEFLAGLYYVDNVVIFEEDTPAELLAKVRPHIVVKGGDYKPEDVVANGVEVRIAPYCEGRSTTNVLKQMS